MKTMKQLFSILIFTIGGLFQTQAQDPFTNGLVAYYPFNGNANDASGNGNNGVVTGATPTQDRFGNNSLAYAFNDTNAVITLNSLASVNLTELTISVWVKPIAPWSGYAPIIEKWRGYSFSREEYGLQLEGDLGVRFSNGRHGTGYFSLPNQCALITTNHLSLGQWHHIVTTLDSSGAATIWVNGILRAQDNILQLLPPTIEPVLIGQAAFMDGSVSDSFHGAIDDLRIYNRALSSNEVALLSAMESGSRVDLIKAVKPSFSGLSIGTNYQLQVSGNLNSWTNQGSAFIATNSSMFYPQYFDVDNWGSLFFRLQVSP